MSDQAPLDYATRSTANPDRDRRGGLIALAQILLVMFGVCGLFAGFVTYGVAMGDVGDEPYHPMVGVGKAVMVCAAAALGLAWWLPRRRRL